MRGDKEPLGRRKFERFALTGTILFRAETGPPCVGRLINLSFGGLFINTPDPLEVGATLDVKFTLPLFEKTFEMPGIVRWKRKGHMDSVAPSGMGIGFSELSDEDTRRINQYIASTQITRAQW